MFCNIYHRYIYEWTYQGESIVTEPHTVLDTRLKRVDEN